MIRRREFITLLGGATAAWPLAARAQQPDRTIRQIGVLMGTAESDPNQKALVSVFTQALADTGWKEGTNIRIEQRWGEGDVALLRTKAAELARFKPDAASSADNLDSVRECHRPSRHWSGLKSRVSRRQYHRLHQLRIVDGRKMAGISERDCAEHKSRRGHSQS
jgi:hypothetical protein